MNKKTLVLGIGNPILGDDGVGIHVVRSLKPGLESEKIVFDEATTSGLELAEKMQGFDKAVLIDAMRTKEGKIGDIHRLTIDNMPPLYGESPHDLDLLTALKFMRQNTVMPEDIKIYGIESGENDTFSDKMSPKMTLAAKTLIEELREALR